MLKRNLAVLLCALLVVSFANAEDRPTTATTDDGSWFILSPDQLNLGPHHTKHLEVFGRSITGYNRAILAGIDKVQSKQSDGGGYFTGVKAVPAESPIGYPLKLLGQPMLSPPRSTSYCSGSSYSAFIESLNLIFDPSTHISPDRLEALRMQEPDGGRREDGVKAWGNWNADGWGTQFALVQYTGAGTDIKPNQLRPGDFLNISWKSGNGHSVVFLGFAKDAVGKKSILYWSSQKGTNGLGDQMSSLDKIDEVKCVRLTDPQKLLTFDVNKKIDNKVPGDKIKW
jgi:hypothetical protein